MRGRQSEPPLTYAETMDLAKGVLCRAGHSSLNNLFAIDPYANRAGFGDDEVKRLRDKVSSQAMEIKALKDEVRTLKRGGRSSTSYGHTTPGKSFSQMSGQEKRAITCENWNKGSCGLQEVNGGCGQGNSRKKHACSKLTTNDKICWGRHTEQNHI